MYYLFIFACCFLFVIGLVAHAENEIPSLIPLPEKVDWRNGKFQLSQETFVIGQPLKLREYFIAQLKSLIGLSLMSGNNEVPRNQIILNINSKLDTSNIEAYTLAVSNQQIEITGTTEEGLFRGIQTFYQLIPAQAKSQRNSNTIKIANCYIQDKPKFKWRGLNLDCCRHFMTKDFIKRYIDILAYYKFNRLHWHLTEDQGWRIEIKKYPKLTQIGAWRKEADGSIYGGFYTQDEIKEIVAYAQERFITIVPEIEMPGHSVASLASYPENSCSGGPFEVVNYWGVMKDIYCAGRDSTFFFLQDILDEVMALFPSKYIHIGGDEAPKDRWEACPKCQARIKNEGLKNEHELQSYFIKRIASYLQKKGMRVIGWDEILEGGLAPGAIVQSWQSFDGAIEAAKLGHYTICSPESHTYLNHDPDDLDLRIAYSFQPIPDELSEEEEKYVIGSETNLWTEQAPQETVDSKLFPRILALAEVFWRNPQNKNYNEFYTRVKNTYNDLEALGIQYGRESKVIIPETSWDEDERAFIVSITKGQKDILIRYTLDGTTPDSTSALYTEPIKIDKSTSLKIAAYRANHFIGMHFMPTFKFHKAIGAALTLINPYDERYRAGGKNGLIDGVKATPNLHDGLWQGFEGVDFEAIIDLGEEKEIYKITPTFLLDVNSWVFLPEEVAVAIAKTKESYFDQKELTNNLPQKNSEIIIKDFTMNFSGQQARYVRVWAKSIIKCPEWHPGAGGPAWLFIDEIVVE